MMKLDRRIRDAFQSGKICEDSYNNLNKWLTGKDYAEYHSEITGLVDAGDWSELDDRFYKLIEFGTGGRRGPRGAGPNRINWRTIGESAQGLASYIHKVGDPSKGVVIAFDTRHASREFAREVSCVLAANGIKAYLYPEPRSTPQLSFSIRHLQTQSGCMISASHNPPSDNGIKVSWDDGGQVLPPHDKGIIAEVSQVGTIQKMEYESAIELGLIEILNTDIDQAYMENLESLTLSDARDARIAYSPLHGVGTTNVVKLLEHLGFDLVTEDEQMIPDPDFSSVKNRLPNPELPAAMERVTELGRQKGAAVAMASDPDADRLGATVPCPLYVEPSGWIFLNGNQIGVLILDHILNQLDQRGEMPANPVVIKTIVTTEMLDALCHEYGVSVIKDLLVGFKYIAEVTRELPPDRSVIFSTEESHGYNRGLFVRDKDSAPAALHMAELACELTRQGKTIYNRLDELYRKYGYFCELTRSVYYHGKSGREIMHSIMDNLRSHPPNTIDGMPVKLVVDRMTNEIRDAESGEIRGHIHQHSGNVMAFYFDETGLNRITARPSGTEPKIKFYAQLWAPVPEGISGEALHELKSETQKRAEQLIDVISNPEV